MSRRWSALIILASTGFILAAAMFQDIRTPGAVTWEPVEAAGPGFDRATGLVLQHATDGVLWANDGLSIYQSQQDRGFLRVADVKPPLGPAWLAYSRTLRRWFGLEEAIEVFPLSPTVLMVFVGGEIQRLDLDTGSAEVVHRLRYYGRGEGRGVMPFGMTVDREGRFYYGEYVTRRLGEAETIALFRSDRDGRDFEIVYEFSATAVRHIHAVQWDVYGDVLWMGTGDGDEQSRIGYSKDGGETFIWIGQGSQDFRTVNFIFAEDHVDWLSDTIEIPSRALRWRRENWEIQRSARSLPGHGQYIEPIGGGFSLGTTGEEAVSLWLIGPELDLEQIMEWPLGEAGLRGFGTIRLARHDQSKSGEWLYFSPLRIQDRTTAIYRLSTLTAFAAAGVDPTSRRRIVSRDDP